MRWAVVLATLGQLALGGIGCSKQAEPGPSGSEQWPYQLYLSPSNLTNYGVQVDDKYVYWLTGYRVFRANKSGEGDPFELLSCPECHLFSFAVEAGFLYLHGSSSLLRVDRETGAATRVSLVWDHQRSGGLALDDQYVYSVMPGCAAITRVNKQTMTFDQEADVQYIETEYPRGPGLTLLARAGSRLVCGAPEKLFVIDEWHGQVRLVHEGINELTGLIGVGEDAYWMERGALGRIGPDGQALVLANSVASIVHLGYVRARQKLVWGQGGVLRSFSLETQTLDPMSPELFEGSNDVAVDEEAAYATASALIEPIPQPPARPFQNWIAKVPLKVFIPEP